MSEAIILFTRVPLKGKTKTRLEGFLNKEECRDIHISFLKDIRKVCISAKRDVFIIYTPEKSKEVLVNILGDIGEYYPQVGDTLGEKMCNAIDLVLGKGYDKAILIGSDIPEITVECIESSFNKLQKSDVIIGPTVDSGYYLIGMKKCYENIFKNQIYGYGNVFLNTIKKIEEEKLKYSIAEKYLDIDEKEDIYLLYKRLIKQEVVNCKYTFDFIKRIMEEKNCIE